MANCLIPLIVATALMASCSPARIAPAAEAQLSANETEVKFDGAGITLVGTLEMPSKSGKAPAMLLLPGSGPSDRDGNQLPGLRTDLLKQIAKALADHGIASLRFDKRATRGYQPLWPKDYTELNHFFAWQKFVDDATDAYRFLQSHAGIDASRVGILGHSEGSEIALQIAQDLSKQNQAPAALVLVGGTGRPMGPILHEQIARELQRANASPEITKQYLDYLDQAADSMAKGGSYPPNPPGGLATLFNPTTVDVLQAYFRIDPSELAKDYPGPVLVMNGGHDTQVSPERDAPRLQQALASRGHGFVKMFIVPDASHNLKSTKAGNDDQFEGPVIPDALTAITSFLTERLIGK